MPHHNSMTITQKGDRNETYEPTSIIRSLLRNGYDPIQRDMDLAEQLM